VVGEEEVDADDTGAAERVEHPQRRPGHGCPVCAVDVAGALNRAERYLTGAEARPGPDSRLHPRVLSRIRIHRRATVVDSSGTQFVMPKLTAVDLTQPVCGTVLRQPSRGIERADVDRPTQHMSRRLRIGHPPRGLFLRAVLDDSVLSQLLLILGRPPTTVDPKHDAVGFCVRRRPT
jgi:hypothetical protein